MASETETTTNDTSAAQQAPAEVTYLDNNPRSTTVPLKFPFRIGDQEFRSVTVRRISGMEAKQYAAAIGAFWRNAQKGTGQPEPLYPGVDLPREAFPHLDADDLAAVEEAADAFFPEWLRPAMEAVNGLMALSLAQDTMPASGESEPAMSPAS